MKYLQLEHVEMVFDTPRGRFHALRDINLNVEQGEFVSIIGHSGCGKSTLLNLVAGLTLPRRDAVRRARDRGARPGTRDGVSKSFTAAVAHGVRKRAPRGRQGVRPLEERPRARRKDTAQSRAGAHGTRAQ